jgi:hypothetical protein
MTCQLSRSGDLVNRVVVEVLLKRGEETTFYVAEQFLKHVELYIGGNRIDYLTNTWLRVYDELCRPIDQREAYRQMADFADVSLEPVGTVKRFYITLPFWFSGNPSAALPLIALHSNDVELRFEFASSVKGVDPSYTPQVSVWCDYVFLEKEERVWFAQHPQEYLIEQLQMTSQTVSLSNAIKRESIQLPFNHPVKYLAWVAKPDSESHGLYTADHASGEGLQYAEANGPMYMASLTLNGRDRFEPRVGSYFRLHHPLTVFGQAPSVGVYVYSFAMHPTSWVPSGTLNFSRIEDARLHLHFKKAVLEPGAPASSEDVTTVGALGLKVVDVFARNFNIIKFDQGMAAILYAN